MTIPRIELNDGTSIPQLGLGVFQVPPPETARVVADALEAGYRHIDTAQMYGNEGGVGQAIAESGLPRDELYVTTKLGQRLPPARRRATGVRRSLTKLGLDRVDLFLIHWPLPILYDGDFVSTWQTLVEVMRTVAPPPSASPTSSRTTSTGSSTRPASSPWSTRSSVHPFFRNDPVRAANRRLGVVTEAWAPLAKGSGRRRRRRSARSPAASGRTPAQVVLRWHLQRGHVVFPKTTRPERMRENADLFDFELVRRPDACHRRPRPR